jgi:DNA-binding MarR family transcriptional regulator
MSAYMDAMKNRCDIQRAFGFLVADTARVLRKVVDQRARRIGMSRAQWAILATLHRGQEGMRQVDLANQMDLEPITVARLLDRLETAGLVERRPDPDDRRARRVYLRPAAHPVIEQLKKIGDELLGGALNGVTEHEIEIATTVLTRVRENLQGRAGDAGHSGDKTDVGQTEQDRRAARQFA